MLRPMNPFAARLEVEIARAGLTKVKLAEKLGTSPQAVRDLIHRGRPSSATLHKLAEVLGCSAAVLLTDVTPEEYGAVMLGDVNK